MIAREPVVVMPFLGASIGGSYLSAITLARALRRRGRRVNIVVHHAGPVTQALDEWGDDYLVLDAGSRGTSKVRAELLWEAWRWLGACKCDIVHTQDTEMHVIWGAAARMRGTAQVWHQRKEMRRKGRYLLSLIGPRRVIAISQFVASSMPMRYRQGAAVIPNSVDLTGVARIDRAGAREQVRRLIGANQDMITVGFFGNFEEQKRPEMVAMLSDRFRNQHLHFLMYGEDRIGFARKHCSANHPNLHICAFTPRVLEVMTGCDVIVAPGVREGFGRTLIEANAAGVPVLAARSGGHGEIIVHGRNGLLFNPDDIDDAAAQLKCLLADRNMMNRLKINGQIAAEEMWSSEIHCDRMVGQYAKAME